MLFSLAIVFNIVFVLYSIIITTVEANNNVPVKPKLVYFDAKGAGELSRVLMKVGQLEFEDFRFPIVVSCCCYYCYFVVCCCYYY